MTVRSSLSLFGCIFGWVFFFCLNQNNVWNTTKWERLFLVCPECQPDGVCRCLIVWGCYYTYSIIAFSAMKQAWCSCMRFMSMFLSCAKNGRCTEKKCCLKGKKNAALWNCTWRREAYVSGSQPGNHWPGWDPIMGPKINLKGHKLIMRIIKNNILIFFKLFFLLNAGYF